MKLNYLNNLGIIKQIRKPLELAELEGLSYISKDIENLDKYCENLFIIITYNLIFIFLILIKIENN